MPPESPIDLINAQLRAGQERAAASEFKVDVAAMELNGELVVAASGSRLGNDGRTTVVAQVTRPIPEVVLDPGLVVIMVEEVEKRLRLMEV